ncbi:lipopolysaccharide biosynthesis protein [Thermodesulfobacteriota bacterium]
MNHPSSRTGRHLLTGTIRIFLAEALILPTGFITAVFLARSLGPAGYGMFALVSRLILWIEWSSIAGFSGTTIKFIGESSDWRPIGATAMRLHFIVGIGAAALLWLFASPLSSLFDEPTMAGYIKLFAIEIPILSIASACSSILVGTGHYKEKARISTARWIARLILIIMFVEMGLSVNGAILGSIGATLVELIISWYYVRPAFFSGNSFPLRRLLNFGAPLFMSELCQRVFRLDLFALKALGATAAQAGFYGAAMNLSIPPTMFSRSFSPPLLSTLSNLLSNGEHSKAKEISIISTRSIIWLLPFAAMTVGSADEIVLFIFGKEYLPASPILAFLIFAAIGLLAINISRAILTALNKPGWTFILTGPMVPIALIGHLILIPLLGGIGAAVVTASVACLGALVSLFTVYRIWNVFPPIKTLLISLVCSIFAFALSVLWPVSGLFLIPKLLVIIFVVLLILWVLGEFTTREVIFIRSVFHWRVTIKQNKENY